MSARPAIIAGRANPKLAASVAAAAGVELTACDIRQFSDGEIGVEISDNVRGADVFVIQSTSYPGNDHLMELLIVMDALRRASATRITAVLPYFGYARQDRKTRPRVSITAKLVSDLIVCAGAHRVLTMDLHAGQVMGFFNIPVDNLYARPVLLNYVKKTLHGERICIVSPDAGGVPRARAYAKRLDAGLAIIDKRRNAPNEIEAMNVVGDVRGYTAIIVDDIVDTGGTLVYAAEALREAGA
ncbi:MAG TPA: ribose-phosphate pyrophosphokinase, partial [Oligoflexia bacterium]|nr:ribose-phosphate pyrophosphokinase [Oligoflexia bacterium]